jgi:hypothetical protein
MHVCEKMFPSLRMKPTFGFVKGNSSKIAAVQGASLAESGCGDE